MPVEESLLVLYILLAEVPLLAVGQSLTKDVLAARNDNALALLSAPCLVELKSSNSPDTISLEL